MFNIASENFSVHPFLYVSDRIRPICLPLNEPLRSTDLTGYAPFVAGWGSTFYQGPQSSILRETQVEVISTSKCEQSYKTAFPNQIFDERIICAGTGGHDTCQGDSGGPLMVVQVSFKREPVLKWLNYNNGLSGIWWWAQRFLLHFGWPSVIRLRMC